MKTVNYISIIFMNLLILALLAVKVSAVHDHGSHVHADHHDQHAVHEHYTVPANEPGPSLSLVIHEDPVAGWNLQLVTENFTFAPYHAGLNHIPGEGHAHLYVNDVKAGRILGPWHHLDGLTSEHNTVRVVLSTNDHRYYQAGGEIVEDTGHIMAEPVQEQGKGRCPRCGSPRGMGAGGHGDAHVH
ncbi:hypothetical protein [Desulfonatronospira sp.]|uniref:hypothetical protein n=1 Tax=Desulfonatronospira sp. TaxID=1962951 RepID=UPI0025BB3C81|nr:hypothetical protein [Desulfonatronospira sp.]